MASETSSSEQSFMDHLINSRNRDISLFFPFILGLNSTSTLQETENQESPDRVVLINPFTQGMVVIERSHSSISNTSSLRFDSLLNDLFSSKNGRPPASKASIDAMESVEIVENDDEKCVICLEEWVVGEKAKKMPCNHRFHGECIEKWLKIHGSCPVCRYEMPVDEDDGEKKRNGGEREGERRREIWVSFTFSNDRRSGGNDQAVSSESSENQNSDSFLNHQEMQG